MLISPEIFALNLLIGFVLQKVAGPLGAALASNLDRTDRGSAQQGAETPRFRRA